MLVAARRLPSSISISGLRNLDLVMGCERRVVYDFVNVINGDCTLKQALIKDKRIDTLFVLAASQTRDKEALSAEGVRKVLDELIAEGFDYILCDSPAGIEKGAHLAMYFADRADRRRESRSLIGARLGSHPGIARQQDTAGPRRATDEVKEHLLLTRYSPRRVAAGEMMSVDDVKEILGIDVIGVIPESPDVLSASNAGTPVILNEESDVARAYEDAVARLLGETLPLRFIEEPKKGFFARVFGG